MDSHADYHMLDALLYILPLDSTEAGVWQRLPLADACSTKASCRSGRLLADLLTASATHKVPYDDEAADYDFSMARTEGTEEQELQLASNEAARHAAWLVSADIEMQQRCASLARLRRVTTLSIKGGDDLSGFASNLRRFGDATKGSVLKLSLSEAAVTWDAATAVGLAFPDLRELVLDGQGDVEVAALEQLTRLEKLVVQRERGLLRDAIFTLGSLTTLKHLDINHPSRVYERGPIPSSDLLSWTGLVHLQSCKFVEQSYGPCALADIMPVLTLTQLTCLEWLHVKHTPLPDGLVAPDTVTAALVLLGGLVNLECLALGNAFVVDDAAAAALWRLTRLTSLGFGTVQLQLPAVPGRLPALARLSISGRNVGPSEMMQILLPLKPLASLTHLSRMAKEQTPDPGLIMHGGADPAVLRQVAQHLAAAPNLVLHQARLYFEADTPMPLADLGWALKPLAHSITTLGIWCSAPVSAPSRRMAVGGGWEALAACLPGLSELCMHRCALTDAEMADLGLHLTALQRLSAERCGGFSEVGWHAAAALTTRPLTVCAYPKLSAELMAGCETEAERAHGRPGMIVFE